MYDSQANTKPTQLQAFTTLFQATV
jgi:hypothetical protein